jgi:hypothetical protein
MGTKGSLCLNKVTFTSNDLRHCKRQRVTSDSLSFPGQQGSTMHCYFDDTRFTQARDVLLRNLLAALQMEEASTLSTHSRSAWIQASLKSLQLQLCVCSPNNFQSPTTQSKQVELFEHVGNRKHPQLRCQHCQQCPADAQHDASHYILLVSTLCDQLRDLHH